MDDKEFKEIIQECMMYKDSIGIKKFILEDKFKQEDQFWELLGILGGGVTEDNYNASYGFFDSCERCMKYLVRVGNPKELLLALLEDGDNLNDPIRFQTYLQLIQEVIVRLPSKQIYSLELSLETLNEVIRNLELPANLDLEGEERRAEDLDPDVDKINRYLSAYIDFLQKFRDECLKEQDEIDPKTGSSYRRCLNSALLKLLNHPLVYFDLTVHIVNERVVRSNSRVLAEKITCMLCELNTAILDLIEECLENNDRIKRLCKGGSADDFDMEESTPILSLACLSYLLYKESVVELRCSCLYSCQGNMENNLIFVLELMKHQKSGVHTKGVMLLDCFIQHLDNVTSLSYSDLDRPEYFQILDAMFDVMVHSPVKDTRRICVTVLPSFIKLFDMKARYQIFVKIFGTVKHSGVYGYCVQLFKNQIDEVLSHGQTGSSELDLFCDLNLKKILLLVTSLSDNSATDMIEHSDRLIADMNLIRYLVLRDPPSKNRTGFWNFFPILEKEFLKPMQVGLDMSKGHYKCELSGLESGKVEKSENKDVEMSVSVAGFSLPKMDRVQKMEILRHALNTLDLMTSLFVRVTELIDQKQREDKEPILSHCRFAVPCMRHFSQSADHTDSEHHTESEHNHTGTEHTNEDPDEREYDTKQRILKSSLPFVKEHGWTQNALIAGAESEGLPGVAHGLFPRGGVELIFYFYNDCNKRLAEQLAEQVKQEEESENKDQGAPRIRPFIRGAIETRLRMITPYIDKWPQAMGIMALPPNAPEALSNLLNLTDEIWYYAGDRSTDFNWYTKRMSLGAVYKATEVYMVQDKSEDFDETWQFLDRRIEDLTKVSKVARQGREGSAVLMEACKGLSIMARNVIGVNSRAK